MRKKLLYGFLIAAILFYLVTVFVFKTDSTALARYHITDQQLRLIGLIFVIPTFFTWAAGVYSIDKTAHYVSRIKKTKDGGGMRLLMWGLGVLGLGTICNGLISRSLTYAVNQGMVNQATSTIITTHFSVAYILVCFLVLFLGAGQLLRTVKNIVIPISSYLWVTFAMIAISVPYVLAVLSNPSRTVATGTARTATYAMSDWLILLTIVMPYLIAWTFGFFTVLLLDAYQKNIGGILYKRALKKLNMGFFIIIILTVVLQFLNAFSPIILGWVLSAILLLLAVILVFMVIGYLYIARGAKGLTKLEEVT